MACAFHVAVTQPVPVVAGSTVLLTRRTLRRHHLFRPDAGMKQLYLYTLAACARRYQVEVHAFCLMSTHPHEVVTDVLGQLPKFKAAFRRAMALGTKVLRKWEGCVWDDARSTVALETPESILEKMAYTVANPTTSGVVKRPEQWPGVRSGVDELGQRVYRVTRPDFYFGKNDPNWPEEVELRLSWPDALRREYAGDEPRMRSLVQEHVERLVASAHKVARERRWRFPGASRALRSSPYQRATSYEPLRARNPTFAVGSGNRDAFFAAVAKLRTFRAAYRAALEKWRSGIRDVVFPYGTWLMQALHSARVAPGPCG